MNRDDPQALLIAKELGEQDLHLARSLIPESTKGFIFLGTPHHGSNLTLVGKLLSLLGFWGNSNTNLLDVVKPGSKQNEDLHNAFMMEHKTKQIVNFCEVRPETLGPFPIMQVSLHMNERVWFYLREFANAPSPGGVQKLGKYRGL